MDHHTSVTDWCWKPLSTIPSSTGEAADRHPARCTVFLCKVLLKTHLPTHSVCCSMEVGVCAEAYQGREPLRHINSAFMTFEVLDSEGKTCTLPHIRPEPVVSFPNILFLRLRDEVCEWRRTLYLNNQSTLVTVIVQKKNDFNIFKLWVSFCFHSFVTLKTFGQDGKRRYQEAIARRKIRLDRSVTFFSQFNTVTIEVKTYNMLYHM